jgi:hypothetical protein
MNGTSRAALIEQYVAPFEKLREGLEALRKSAPHGRDYYVQGRGVLDPISARVGAIDVLGFRMADMQHRDRVERVAKVVDELEDILLKLTVG